MAAPTVISVTPGPNATGVVLGSPITVTFDQVVDITTVSDSTFVLIGPGQTAVITPTQMIAEDPSVITGREYITGTFSFATVDSQTVVTFNPGKPLQPDQTYSVLVLGSGGALTSDAVKNGIGEAMVGSYQWSFTTGTLNLVTPPVQSPIPWNQGRINPIDVRLLPRAATGNDLTQDIELVFPGPIDPASFNLTDVLVSLEAIIGDPDVVIPQGVTATVAIDGSILRISLTGLS